MKIVAANATMIVLKNTEHWIVEENPKKTTGCHHEVSLSRRPDKVALF